jgi:nitrate reductase beta subunit
LSSWARSDSLAIWMASDLFMLFSLYLLRVCASCHCTNPACPSQAKPGTQTDFAAHRAH